MAPYRDVVKPEVVPPQIQHRLIETQDSFSPNAGGRGRKLFQVIVKQGSLGLIDRLQQMP